VQRPRIEAGHPPPESRRVPKKDDTQGWISSLKQGRAESSLP